MAAAISVYKIVEEYKMRGQTKEKLGQKFTYYMSWKTIIKCWDQSSTYQSKKL